MVDAMSLSANDMDAAINPVLSAFCKREPIEFSEKVCLPNSGRLMLS